MKDPNGLNKMENRKYKTVRVKTKKENRPLDHLLAGAYLGIGMIVLLIPVISDIFGTNEESFLHSAILMICLINAIYLIRPERLVNWIGKNDIG
jgi:hypothetical protein